jgi:hypothetical protein
LLRIGWIGTQYTYQHAYDRFGNRWSQAGGTQTFTDTFNATSNQLADAVPKNGRTDIVLSAGFPPAPTPLVAGAYTMYWHILQLKNGQVTPHYSPSTGYGPTLHGSITLLEDQGHGFTSKFGAPQPDTATDFIYAGKTAPFYQQWFVDKRPVQVVVGGTNAKPQLAWGVKVVVTPKGPVYTPWP